MDLGLIPRTAAAGLCLGLGWSEVRSAKAEQFAFSTAIGGRSGSARTRENATQVIGAAQEFRSAADLSAMLRSVALALTVLTGASGLVYQVAWQKVLAILLGSHGEATAAVLALFLGGLSFGYALFGHVSRRVVARAGSLLFIYGIVESAIGVIALVFPWLFAGIRALSLALPQGAPALAFAFDVGLSALLVLPPTILMGGTIPLLTQGLSKNLEDATRFHSAVYGFNTAGAFVGALAGAFVLIPAIGLENSIRSMGVVNLAAGFCFIALRRRGEASAAPASENADSAPNSIKGLSVYVVVALLAGFAMMSLQTILNRIGALALGASPFTFGMVVAIFVLCIAVGSFVVAALPRIRSSWLALSQWLLVAILVILYPKIENVGFWAYVLHSEIGLTTPVFPFYTSVFAWLLAIALVPLALSGALLPLLFHHLRERADDLGRVAGRLYAWNTAGSLLGALLGGYLLLFWLDLHHVYRLAVAALALGAALLTPKVELARAQVAGLALAGVLGVIALQPEWRADRLSAGLFRSQVPVQDIATTPDAYFAHPERFMVTEVMFSTDDPSTTVTVVKGLGRGILVNGKSDGEIPTDDVTTGLLALLPAMLAERCERAFVIGFGTGKTVGELAALDSTLEVVVAEISPGVVEAAPIFEAGNRHALSNPKTRLVRSDAYRALLRNDSQFDVIVSEPSNPWVTGVENLYAIEFLSAARERLASGGVYAQWFHLYETDDESLELVLGTFRQVFGRVAIWFGGVNDLVILGFENDAFENDLARFETQFARRDFHDQLLALPVSSFPRLVGHELLPPGVVRELELPDRAHTLLHPLLSDIAARAFYRKAFAKVPIGLGGRAAEIGTQQSLARQLLANEPDTETRLEFMRAICNLNPDTHCATVFAHWLHEDRDHPKLVESLARARASSRLAGALRSEFIEELAGFYGKDAGAQSPATFDSASELSELYARYYHYAVPFDPASLSGAWQRCAETSARCRARLEEMRAQNLGRARFTSR
jgi:spermidine synthase